MAYSNIHKIQLHMEQESFEVDRVLAEGPEPSIELIAPNLPFSTSTLDAVVNSTIPPLDLPVDAFAVDSIDHQIGQMTFQLEQLKIQRANRIDHNLVRPAGAPAILLTSASDLQASAPIHHMPGPGCMPGNPLTRDYSRFTCYFCHRKGHIAMFCPRKATELICTNCNRPGHYSEQCSLDISDRVLWMRQMDAFTQGVPRPPLEDFDDDRYNEADCEKWDKERRLFMLECKQFDDYNKGNSDFRHG